MNDDIKKKKNTKKKLARLITIGIIVTGLLVLWAVYAPHLQMLAAKIPPSWVDRMPFLANLIPIPEEPPAQEAFEAPKIVPIIARKMAREDFQDILPTMGTVKGEKEVELRFEVNGVIDSINFKESDIVEKGDVVATLNQKDALLKLEYSESKLKTAEVKSLTAKKKLEIYQNLYKIGAIIKPKLEEVELEYKNAQSETVSADKEVDFAKAELDKTYLLSPIEGVMGPKDAEAGEFITSQNKLGSIIDIGNIFVEAGIIEKEFQKIAFDQIAEVTVDAYPGTKFKGAIDNILPVVEGKSRTLTCKIKLDNPEAQLLPGMFARADIFVFEQEDAIVLPNSALLDQDGDGQFDATYVVNAESTAELREIAVGYVTSDDALVNAGVEEGELVVIEARGELSDGVKVEVIETQEPLAQEAEVQEGVGLPEGLPAEMFAQ